MQERLLFHAGQLLGTPFVAHAMIPGAGMDCIHVCAWVYLQTGFLKTFQEPHYTLDGGKHLQRSALIAWLEESKLFVKVETPQIGDTLCFKFRARVEHHVGLALSGTSFVHCLSHRAVETSDWSHSPYKQMLSAVYRPRL